MKMTVQPINYYLLASKLTFWVFACLTDNNPLNLFIQYVIHTQEGKLYMRISLVIELIENFI